MFDVDVAEAQPLQCKNGVSGFGVLVPTPGPKKLGTDGK